MLLSLSQQLDLILIPIAHYYSSELLHIEYEDFDSFYGKSHPSAYVGVGLASVQSSSAECGWRNLG